MTEAERSSRQDPGERVYSVSEVTAQIKAVLEASLPLFWVEGEISNFVHHASGHMYFTLKDDKSKLSSVMFKFRNKRLRFVPEDGQKVLAWGQIRVYEPSGRYQLYVEEMRPSGVGDLAAAFEKLKRKLESEGLFDAGSKKSLPEFPRTVAVVTSPTGAAVRDVARVIRARSPGTRVVVVPALVQGPGAAPDIARAIRLVDEWGEADVVIVGRGGGSLEDLWAFNEEEVARAIYAAATPVVSAVGHEVDFTIADFVADVRASTPSNAGELVVPDGKDLRRAVTTTAERLVNAVAAALRSRSDRLDTARAAYGLRVPMQLVDRFSERVDELVWRLASLVRGRVDVVSSRLAHVSAELRLADPSGILARGFAAVGLLPELALVRSVGDVRVGREVRVTVADGTFDCRVESVAPRGGRKS